MSSEKIAVLLIAHGSPESTEEVPAFLRNITSGRPLPSAVIEEVQHRYAQIGRSPLTEITMRQAEGLRRALQLPVYVGMRNWKPYIADTVAQMVREGITRAAAICLAPQNSRTSVGLYRRAVLAEAGTKITIEFVDSWHDHPLLIQAFAEKLSPAWRFACSSWETEMPVLFTAHSVPERTIQEGDPYDVQCRETAALVAAKVPGLEPANWRFAFQSQGMSGGAWIGPTVEETIVQLQAAGAKAVILQPIGFVCDHVEILYDIDIGFKEFAEARGMRLTRTQSLNDSPAFIVALADLAASTLGIASPQKVPS